MILQHKKIALILIVLTAVCLLAASGSQTRIRRTRLSHIDNQRQSNLNKDSAPLYRNPPANLTAEIVDNVNVRLTWEEPTDLIRILYHNNINYDGYIQYMDEAYGTVFDLTDYPEHTLEFIDFRHSSWDLLGEWDYTILVIDFEDGELITSIDSVTTLNDGWESRISLERARMSGLVGIFIVPRGNAEDDAFPVIDFDDQMDGNSMIIDPDTYEIMEEADGDFLINLYIRPVDDPARGTAATQAPRLTRNKPHREQLVYRNPIGYNVYRNEELIAEVDGEELTYLDEDLPDDTYEYYVTALYEDEEESEPSNPVVVNIIADLNVLFFDDFSEYPDFVTTFPPWTTLNLDGSITFGFTNNTFPNEYQPMAWMVFNPAATFPPITTIRPHSGTKLLASFASEIGPNNKWLISPRLMLGTFSSLSFQIYSFTAQFGLERFRVGISLTEPEPGSFQIVYPEPPNQFAEAPVIWTEINVNLSEFDNQPVYIAIQNISYETFILFLDSFKVMTVGGSNVEQYGNAPLTGLSGNYPNPFNPETTIYYDLHKDTNVALEVFNVKGQRVRTLVNEYVSSGQHQVLWNGTDDGGREVSAGVYYYRITTDDEVKTGKMLMLK